MSNQDRLLKLFFEASSMRKLARSHRQTLLTDDMSDNIASHSFLVAVISYFLAKEEGVDSSKCLLMGLLHDLSETRSGDQNWVHKKYVSVDEEKILFDQLNGLTKDNESYELLKEYHERKTPESVVVKDADLLAQIYLLREYATNGNLEAQDWLDSREQEKRMSTKYAKSLAKKLYTTDPHIWWSKIWTSERK